jgi:hypothetical protein
MVSEPTLVMEMLGERGPVELDPEHETRSKKRMENSRRPTNTGGNDRPLPFLFTL